ncbi:hypothetical protein TNCV_2640201 [Trichonephila clavipes]|nr:hypothetical protein TNCV_2640201 [Trichonephila clavipes]
MCSSCSARGDGLSLHDKRASRELKLVLFWYAMTHEPLKGLRDDSGWRLYPQVTSGSWVEGDPRGLKGC